MLWFGAALIGLAGCGAPSTPSPVAPAVASAPQITLHATSRGGQSVLRVDLLLPASMLDRLAPQVRLHLPTEHGGRRDLLEALQAFEARTHPGAEAVRIEALADGRIRAVPEDAGSALRFTYEVAPSRDALTVENRYRALRLGDALFLPAHAVLVQPDPGVDLPWRVHLGPGVHWPGRRPGAEVDFDALVNSAFLVGPWQRHRVEREGWHAEIWASGPLHADLPGAIATIGAQQRELVGEPLHAIVLPRVSDRATGFALRDAIVLEVPRPTAPPDAQLLLLVAHENLHRVIGHRIRFADAEAWRTLWFREGVTDYLAWRTLVQHGHLPAAALRTRMEEALARNARFRIPHSEWPRSLDATFWGSAALQHFPYDHGLLLALLVDAALREEGGGQSLGDFVAWLAACERAPLDQAALRRLLERYSGRDWAAFWEGRVQRVEGVAEDAGWRLAGLRVEGGDGVPHALRVADAPRWHTFLTAAPIWQRPAGAACGPSSAMEPADAQ